MATRGPLSNLADEELISRASDLDTAALAELYDRHAPTALAIARRMLGAARAEDAVQDAFTSIWRSASTYDPQLGLVRTWLLRIVRHRSLDILRSAAAEDRRIEHAGREQHHAEPAEGPAAATQRRDEADELHAVLDALPEEQRQVVELAYYDGLTQVEISERLGLPVGTVKSRARLALHKLRESLDPAGERAG